MPPEAQSPVSQDTQNDAEKSFGADDHLEIRDGVNEFKTMVSEIGPQAKKSEGIKRCARKFNTS